MMRSNRILKKRCATCLIGVVPHVSLERHLIAFVVIEQGEVRTEFRRESVGGLGWPSVAD
jgi:hypothetical protein